MFPLFFLLSLLHFLQQLNEQLHYFIMGAKAAFLASLPEQIRNPNNCWVEKLPGVPYSAGYRPSLAAGVTFIILFFSAYAYHVALSIRKKRWASIALAYGAFGK